MPRSGRATTSQLTRQHETERVQCGPAPSDPRRKTIYSPGSSIPDSAPGTSARMKLAMAEIQPIRVEVEREDDGRILASVPDLPGVMAYGGTQDEAIRKVKSIALQVLADMIESGEDVPEPLKVLFAA